MRLAFDLFVDRVAGFVGSYYVTLGGEVDALVFAGGIGERSERLRRAVADRVRCLGFVALDGEKNATAAGGNTEVVVDIGQAAATASSSSSSTANGHGHGQNGGADEEKKKKKKKGARGREARLLVCRTDEQFEMARSCAENEELWS